MQKKFAHDFRYDSRNNNNNNNNKQQLQIMTITLPDNKPQSISVPNTGKKNRIKRHDTACAQTHFNLRKEIPGKLEGDSGKNVH